MKKLLATALLVITPVMAVQADDRFAESETHTVKELPSKAGYDCEKADIATTNDVRSASGSNGEVYSCKKPGVLVSLIRESADVMEASKKFGASLFDDAGEAGSEIVESSASAFDNATRELGNLFSGE